MASNCVVVVRPPRPSLGGMLYTGISCRTVSHMVWWYGRQLNWGSSCSRTGVQGNQGHPPRRRGGLQAWQGMAGISPPPGWAWQWPGVSPSPAPVCLSPMPQPPSLLAAGRQAGMACPTTPGTGGGGGSLWEVGHGRHAVSPPQGWQVWVQQWLLLWWQAGTGSLPLPRVPVSQSLSSRLW